MSFSPIMILRRLLEILLGLKHSSPRRVPNFQSRMEMKTLYKSPSTLYENTVQRRKFGTKSYLTRLLFLRGTFWILEICKVFSFPSRDKNRESTLQISGTCRRRRFVKCFHFHVEQVLLATSKYISISLVLVFCTSLARQIPASRHIVQHKVLARCEITLAVQ